ncbi:MAG TPA: DNA-binding protein [Patescibacteria group bacterium]|nr:DNA-binding protein [Gammaproteobacteria bacterium]HWA51523.1 DNA-binding protein [Patescibacteria group bacterium]
MRQELITYDLFCQAALKMQDDGEKISVRTIHSHIGGSFAKLAVFLKRWRTEQSHAQSQVDHEISTNLRQAILAEIGKAKAETKAQSEIQLSQANEQLEEAHEALAKQEIALEECTQQISQLKQQIAVMNEMQNQQAEKFQALEKKLEQAIAAQHIADKQAAIAETRCSELEKQLLKKEVVVPKEKNDLIVDG